MLYITETDCEHVRVSALALARYVSRFPSTRCAANVARTYCSMARCCSQYFQSSTVQSDGLVDKQYRHTTNWIDQISNIQIEPLAPVPCQGAEETDRTWYVDINLARHKSGNPREYN